MAYSEEKRTARLAVNLENTKKSIENTELGAMLPEGLIEMIGKKVNEMTYTEFQCVRHTDKCQTPILRWYNFETEQQIADLYGRDWYYCMKNKRELEIVCGGCHDESELRKCNGHSNCQIYFLQNDLDSGIFDENICFCGYAHCQKHSGDMAECEMCSMKICKKCQRRMGKLIQCEMCDKFFCYEHATCARTACDLCKEIDFDNCLACISCRTKRRQCSLCGISVCDKFWKEHMGNCKKCKKSVCKLCWNKKLFKTSKILFCIKCTTQRF